VFLSKLIRAIFIVRPDLLTSSEKNISFKDLVDIGSVEAARQMMIEKEVETVIRLSHSDQIDWLERKLDIPLRKDLAIWPSFIEVCEFRNLLTHTGGVVSSQYLRVCRQHGVDIKDKAIGKFIDVPPKYYSKAVQIIVEFGSKLTQVIWRKLVPDELALADTALNEFGYRLITKRRYHTAATMLKFGLYEMKKHGTEATRKRMVVNYANAEKLSGNKVHAESVLDKEDWTASSDDYRICVAAVKDDADSVIRMMKAVADAKLMEISCFRDWPVFENVRRNPKFIEAFEQEFGQKLIADRKAVEPGKKVENGNDAKSADGMSDANEPGNDLTVH